MPRWPSGVSACCASGDTVSNPGIYNDEYNISLTAFDENCPDLHVDDSGLPVFLDAFPSGSWSFHMDYSGIEGLTAYFTDDTFTVIDSETPAYFATTIDFTFTVTDSTQRFYMGAAGIADFIGGTFEFCSA